MFFTTTATYLSTQTDSSDATGDNEVWNLATDPQHYSGITRVMELRENLRSYVASINQQTAATGVPMLRPMFFEFESDSICQTSAVDGQFVCLPGACFFDKVTQRSICLL